MRPPCQLRFQPGKRHHRYKRQGVQSYLLALRALILRRCAMCDFDGPDWMDIALAGSLAEEITEEARERRKAEWLIKKENEEDEMSDEDEN
jgi:hypothetical protein